jgi:DNA-directed RNA polymerase specialized sigma24 family protein
MRKLSAVLQDTSVSSLPLNSLREQYTQGLISRKDFEEHIFQFLFKNYQQFHLFNRDRDAFADYLCWLYPCLSRAIDTYKEAGSSFDAYICSIVRWSAKARHSREADHHVTEYACWEARAEEDMMANENPPAYLDAGESLKPVSNPRQVLILLLKSYFFVSDDFTARVAPAIGVSVEKLTALLDKVRELRVERDEKIRRLQEQLHVQYYRCVAYRKRLGALSEYASQRELLRGYLERAYSNYAGIKQRLANANLEASNRQVAEVLGIPKGTVDSTLYALKQKAKRVNDKTPD